MTDLDIAKKSLEGNTICLCKNGKCMFSTLRGISPMMKFIFEKKNLENYAVADIIVGKAVAMLFIKSGIKAVYARVLSIAAKDILTKYNISFEYDLLVDSIINHQGTGICPMEQAVMNIESVEEAYQILQQKMELYK